MTPLAVATHETDLRGALELGGRALSYAGQAQRAVLVSAALRAEALVLGALQLESSLKLRSPARFEGVVRRLTSGTEAQLSGNVLYHALALPRVDALYPDASPRTLLNRNLRALLRGYTAAGVPLRYFGTEVLALLGHPVALVGYERAENGCYLIEIFVGLDAPCVVRPALRREAPSALLPILRSATAPIDLLQKVVSGVVERLGVSAEDVSAAVSDAPLHLASELVDAAPAASVPIPLGVVEAALTPRLQLSGDLLVGSAALRRFAALLEQGTDATWQGEPLDGARPPDLLQAARAALA